MDFTALATTLSSLFPNAAAFIAQILSEAFICAMFSRRNDIRSNVEEIIAQPLGDYISKLYQENRISGTDLLKCKNLESIAKLADEARKEDAQYETGKTNQEANEQEYDFEWFLRFFERAGYATKEDMQRLWAAVLNKEINSHGSFSYKAIETLYHMHSSEANIFSQMADYSIVTPYGECMLPCSSELYDGYNVTSPVVESGKSDIYAILAAAYGINNERVMYLIESGLLSSLFSTSNFTIDSDPTLILYDCYAIYLELKSDCSYESIEFDVTGYRFTSVARQLFGAIKTSSSLSFCLDYARLIERRYSEFDVRVYSVLSVEEENIAVDDSIDFLHSPDYVGLSEISEVLEIENFLIV